MDQSLYQKIYDRFGLGPALHMTHIENLEGILNAHGLQCKNAMRALTHTSMANEEVQAGRAVKIVNDLPLHDYVPLYFASKTPMAAVNQHQNEDFVFIRFSLNILQLPGVVICDGNARSNETTFSTYDSIESLEILDLQALRNVRYAGDPELKRRKQAEVLVPTFLPIDLAVDIRCFSTEAKDRVEHLFASHREVKRRVEVQPNLYFRNDRIAVGT